MASLFLRTLARRSRLLRVAKWGGVLVCVILLAGQIVGGFRYIEWWNDGFLISVSGGALRIAIYDAGGKIPRWGIWKAGWYPRKHMRWTLLPHHAGVVTDMLLPLWMFAGVIAIPTVVLWRLDRRPLPGHCPCGYDLTGNESGVCPECGRAASEKHRART